MLVIVGPAAGVDWEQHHGVELLALGLEGGHEEEATVRALRDGANRGGDLLVVGSEAVGEVGARCERFGRAPQRARGVRPRQVEADGGARP